MNFPTPHTSHTLVAHSLITGAAGNTKRATSVVLVQAPKDASAEHAEAYAEAHEEVVKVQLSV